MVKAFSRLASTIGTSITSGGIGKNELSRKETTPRQGNGTRVTGQSGSPSHKQD